MTKPIAFAMLRVKDEARWIERVIRSIEPVCARILVLDDSSTDDTVALARNAGAEVFPTPFRDRGFISEAQDKDWLLSKVWECGARVGEHVLCIDGDEVLCQEDIPELEAACRRGHPCGRLWIRYLWGDEQTVRVDGIYGRFTRPSLFKLISKQLSFATTRHGGNLHCSSAPAQLLPHATPVNVRVLHYGYIDRELRLKKYEFYNRIDRNNELEDKYRHTVIGDVFPADSEFKWAGPLKLEALK